MCLSYFENTVILQSCPSRKVIQVWTTETTLAHRVDFCQLRKKWGQYLIDAEQNDGRAHLVHRAWAWESRDLGCISSRLLAHIVTLSESISLSPKIDLDVTIGGTLISPAHVVIAWPHMVLMGLGEIIQARHPIGQLAQPFSHAAQAKRGEGKGREEPGVNYIFMEELLPSFFTPGFVRADYLGGWRIMKNPIYFVVLTHLSCISGELRISYKWILQNIWCLTL